MGRTHSCINNIGMKEMFTTTVNKKKIFRVHFSKKELIWKRGIGSDFQRKRITEIEGVSDYL